MKEIKCLNCQASCCKQGIQLYLTDQEAKFIRSSKTKLKQILPSSPLKQAHLENEDLHDLQVSFVPENHGLYKFESDCGHLVVKDGWLQCSAYNEPNRPNICNNFQEAGNSCRAIRKSDGID